MKFCSSLACSQIASFPTASRLKRGITKTLLVMKLTVFLLTAAFLNVAAKGLSQQVTFTGKNVSLEEVIAVVKKQTGYFFLYKEDALTNAKPVTVKANNMPLTEFLDLVFRNQQLKYSISSKTINIYPSPIDGAHLLQPSGKPISELVLYPPPIKIQITDSAGKPLPGATVVVQSNKSSGMTDAKGFVNLTLQAGDVLLVSFVGFETRRITVNSEAINRGTLVVVMQRDVVNLNEIVVEVNTGYQRIRPEHSTGAISRISTKEFESRVSTNFLDGLVNRLPGLMINNDVNFVSNGGASSRPLFNIRGISTMSANQNPLIVVDGYPTELTLNMIDPNEIKSVTILKDAAAATVYGVRASNGVIVIERKQAVQGKPRFAFRVTGAITPEENYSRYRWADDASAIVTNYQKATLATSVNANSWAQMSAPGTGGVNRSKAFYILAQQAAKIITPEQAANAFAEMEQYDNTGDYKELFLRPAFTQTYNFNVSGGNANALYYITANYTGNKLSQIRNANDRLLLSARSTLKFSRKLSLELTTDYQEDNVNTSPVPGINSIAPFEHFRDVSGNPSFIWAGGISPYLNNVMLSQGLADNLYYPLVDVNEISNKNHTVNNKFIANFNYTIGAGFDLMFGGIYETSRSNGRYFATELSSVARDYVNSYVTRNTDGTLKYNVPKGGFLREQSGTTSSYTARAQLNYNKKFGQHTFNGIVGAELRNLINKSNLGSYFGYNDETLQHQPLDLYSINTGAIRGIFQLGSPWERQYGSLFDQQYTEDRFISGYTNLVYSFRNIYSLSGSIRIDQSNLFGTNPKYKYKPLWSLGAIWNIDREEFMKDVDWVKMMRLRTAYGFNGNVAKMSLPQVIAEAAMNAYTSPSSPSLKLFSYANSSLRWEQTNSFNVGLDYEFSNKIRGSIDYYRKKSIDLLADAQIDPTIGASPSLINRATIKNNGIEFALNADWVHTRNFNWNTGIVVARNTSMVLDVYQETNHGPQTLNSVGYVKGYPVGAMFAYRYAGLDTAGYALIRSNSGKFYHTDDSKPQSPSSIAMNSDTAGVSYYMGPSIPTINAGLSNRIDIGNMYIFCMINYYGGFKVRVPRPNPSALRPLEGAGDYWKVKGDENRTDVMGLAAYSSFNSNNAYNYADKYVVNGDYITLADLTFSYRFDNFRIVKKAGFTNFEVKAQASNIFTVGLNDYNYSMATRSYEKPFLTPTYTLAIFTNF
ncbi:SusC/RagA family TonB-linked outer membrane protein [Pseudoflavitalea rhizosphaerae]|uniref:SusC/RagA family TonB-linked outer membrane protein n=1 Tax=Pseudoflavitalea rhizosphaerae TaxID=1884793 RepID=UPI0019D2CCEB|nr:SusC/RagA family TonB-linked outer membrane protein [Pseudoflavitalea rhizosphaerae]